jgi:uncharacterized protein YjbJ (UPF0337 family)
MSTGTKNQIDGKFHEVKGRIKEKVGQATNNPNLEDEGTVEKVGGKVQNVVGKVQNAVEKNNKEANKR